MVYSAWSTRTPAALAPLVALWARSVRATHTFLSAAEITAIKRYVPQALQTVPTLIVATTADGEPVGFMGIDGTHLAMLFIAPDAQGQGHGRALLTLGIQRYGVDSLSVNEQNPQAVAFYQHMGFTITKRCAHDEQGQPYPILRMHRRA